MILVAQQAFCLLFLEIGVQSTLRYGGTRHCGPVSIGVQAQESIRFSWVTLPEGWSLNYSGYPRDCLVFYEEFKSSNERTYLPALESCTLIVRCYP